MSQKLEGRLQEVFANLSTKEEVMRRITEHSHLLSNIPLPEPITPYEQAHKDFRRERILFNEVPFVPDTTDVNRMHAFSHTITEFITRICGGDKPRRGMTKTASGGYKGGPSSTQHDHSGDNPSAAILDTILRRACRTSAGVDSFFMVQKLLAVEGTLVTQKPVVCDPPIRIDVFLIPGMGGEVTAGVIGGAAAGLLDAADGGSTEVDSEYSGSDYRSGSRSSHAHSRLHLPSHSHARHVPGGGKYPLACRVEVHNFFAVYNTAAMDGITGDSDKDPPPWLEVETIVIDETNFATGAHMRKLKLIIYVPEQDRYYPRVCVDGDL